MNNMIQENINFSKFIEYTHKLQSKYGHVVALPDDLYDIVEILNNPITNKPFGIIISTSTKGTNDNKLRIKLEKKSGDFIYGTLKCDEFLKFEPDGTLQHKYFSFHFEPNNEQDIFYTFRFDYDPKAPNPLHAHDFNYEKTKIHLLFPDHTSLDLSLIDYCTVLQILCYYFLHETKYPLKFGDEYTKLIKITRSTYDEQE